MSRVLDFVDKIYYINLDHRGDRKESITNEIRKIDPNLEKTVRFSAIKHQQGWVGCAASHLKILEECIEKNYRNVIVLEDDFIFKDTNSLERLDYLIKHDEEFNLLLLGRNLLKANTVAPTQYKVTILEVLNAQTTSGYLMSNKIFKPLHEIWSRSYKDLEINPNRQADRSCDITWKALQGAGKKVYTTLPPVGIQKRSYSDIEKAVIYYGC